MLCLLETKCLNSLMDNVILNTHVERSINALQVEVRSYPLQRQSYENFVDRFNVVACIVSFLLRVI